MRLVILFPLFCVFMSPIAINAQKLVNKQENDNPGKPNIVLILSDDQAWDDYGFMGHAVIETPNLDKLASESIVFTRGYVTTPICRPSLMTLATGLYPHQHKITGNDPLKKNKKPVFRREELLESIDQNPSLPRVLQKEGYLSFQSGKWWEGSFERGGFTHGMTEGSRHGDKGLTIGRQGLDTIFSFVDSALAENKPFYLWYAPFMPHNPHTPPDSLYEKYASRVKSPYIAKYYAMVEWFDITCGQLINFLDARGLRENTLVYYLCDNGWIQQATSGKFAARSKQTPMEGGIRTPIMFSWPGRLKPALRNELVSNIDLFPTILGAAQAQLPPGLPGLDLWNKLVEDEPIERDILFGEAYRHDIVDKDDPEASLRYLWCMEGPWKLVLSYEGAFENEQANNYLIHKEVRSEPVRLYNVIEDPYENTNLAKRFPGKVEQLKQRINAWYPLKYRKVLEKKQ
ncbi:MAG: sulfatase [Cytophagales bacterium]|nr:sulfatase [Cytophagales bacterium]